MRGDCVMGECETDQAYGRLLKLALQIHFHLSHSGLYAVDPTRS